ncbi:MAG: GNAT family N-acetyltransferase [Boseongicola sp.]
MLIETDRLCLRPVAADDTSKIAQVVFADPNVVGMLAHNTKDPDTAYAEAERWTKIMGIDGDGGIWDEGGMGLFAVVPKGADDSLAGVAGFYMERNEHGRWNGEYFYALGTAWHSLGLMSEAADAFGKKLGSMDDLGVIYALYWDMINQASGRVIQRTGLSPKGRKPITEEYDAGKCRNMFEYDLWRLSEAEPGKDRDKVLVQVSRRSGGFVGEGVLEKEEALQALAIHYGSKTLTSSATSMFEMALSQPGMAYFEIRGDGERGTPVNRLG